MTMTEVNRRAILAGSGALVVSFTVPALAQTQGVMRGGKGRPPLDPRRLDSYLAVHENGAVTAYFGKIDGGQGTDVGIAQIVAEELDLPADKVAVVMGDTAATINQGGASGSTGIFKGGQAMRHAAAEARQALLAMAAKRLGAAPDQLSVADGVVSGNGKSVSYGKLIGGGYFELQVPWNGKLGNDLDIDSKAPLKDPAGYKVIGTSPPRRDVAAKVFARHEYVTDVRVPGMLHARVIRPPVAGATLVAVDEESPRGIAGVRVVAKNGFLAVVAEKEWNAVRASAALKAKWSEPAPVFASQEELYDHIRKSATRKRDEDKNQKRGDVEAALAGAAKRVEADYEWPFQSHASMGSACAVASFKDGAVTIWTGSQKPHYARDGVAAILDIPVDKVRAIWRTGPGSYGRNDAGDAALEAAVLSQIVGRPVRVQGMRAEGIGWDPKAPASIHRGRAGLDGNGKLVAYHFESKGFSRVDINSNESEPAHSLIGMTWGVPLHSLDGFGHPEHAYEIPNILQAWETIPPLLDRASPLRTAHMRDPCGPQVCFAHESFIDEVAFAAGADPVEFRLRHLPPGRDREVVQAAAQKFGWQSRVASTHRNDSADLVRGRGFAYTLRHPTIVAAAVEVEVDRRTGKVRVVRATVAHDCGRIVNPGLLRNTIEGNVVQGTSRSIHEEVRFDTRKVTSVDWKTYPILDITDAPEQIDIVLLDRRDAPSSGAGEPSTRPIAAAIGNAIFDATGDRIRRAPFSPERVRRGQV